MMMFKTLLATTLLALFSSASAAPLPENSPYIAKAVFNQSVHGSVLFKPSGSGLSVSAMFLDMPIGITSPLLLHFVKCSNNMDEGIFIRDLTPVKGLVVMIDQNVGATPSSILGDKASVAIHDKDTGKPLACADIESPKS